MQNNKHKPALKKQKRGKIIFSLQLVLSELRRQCASVWYFPYGDVLISSVVAFGPVLLGLV